MAEQLPLWDGADFESVNTSLGEILQKYDLVSIHDGKGPGGYGQDGSAYMVVTPKPLAANIAKPEGLQLADGRNTLAVPGAMPLMMELGTSSPSPWLSWVRQEYNQELLGLNGLQKYDRMRKSDGAVRGALRRVKTPVLSARWFIEPASSSTRDKNAADFVRKCLMESMTISWTQVLTESLLMLDFGYYMFEKVYAFGEDVSKDPQLRGKVVWKKMAPRHPMDVKSWKMDANGGPNGVEFYPPDPMNDDIRIPIDKLLVFSFDREAGNMEGISILRSAYKHWYYKDQLYKIDAIQKERHGIGIPIIKLPLGYNDSDKKAAENLGRNLRTNDRAHVVLPPGWELEFAKLQGQPVDALKSIDHHNEMIRENILDVVRQAASASEDTQDLFLKGTRFIADTIAETWNYHAIPQLIDYNFSRVGYPRLKYRRIGEEADWRTLTFAIRNLVGAGALIPDQALEDHLRNELDLPKADPETARNVMTPQNPGADQSKQDQQAEKGSQQPQVGGKGNTANAPMPPKPSRTGPPRQSPPSARQGAGRGNDRTGGK